MITHNTKLDTTDGSLNIQSYFEGGRVALDLNHYAGISGPLRLSPRAATELIGLLEAALNDVDR